jgi:ribonuclease P protein component
LSPENRLRRSADFRRALKSRRRCAARTVVVHAAPAGDASGDARVGFVVSKAVGRAVVRNRVRRRLRHAIRPELARLPGPVDIVVRATPDAAGASFDDLRADLLECLGRLGRPA